MIFADNDDFILTNGIKDSLNYMEKMNNEVAQKVELVL